MRFAGYAAVFDRPDKGGDIIRKGAFLRALERAADVPLLWQHKAGAVIGRIEHLAEDERGLRVIAAVGDARAARLLESRKVAGLSFGYPYAALDATTETDWSHKSGDGREVLVAITLWDDQPVRLHALADDIETQLRTLGTTVGWQLVTMRLVRRRVVRDVAGPWAAAIDFRARMLAA